MMKKLRLFITLVVLLAFVGLASNIKGAGYLTVTVLKNVDGTQTEVSTTSTVAYGGKFDVTIDETADFKYWLINGVLRTDLVEALSIKVYENTTVEAFYATSGHVVTFVDSNLKYLKHANVSSTLPEDFVLPSGLSKPKSNFVGFVLMEDYNLASPTVYSILSDFPSFTSDAIYVAYYEVTDANLYTLTQTVNGATTTPKYSLNTIVTLTDESPSFSYFKDEKNQVLTYSNTYSFSVMGNMTVTAVYNEVGSGNVVNLRGPLALRDNHKSYVGQFDGAPDSFGLAVSQEDVAITSLTQAGVQVIYGKVANPQTKEFLISIKDTANIVTVRAFAMYGDVMVFSDFQESENVLSYMGNAELARVYNASTAVATYQTTDVHEGDLGVTKLSILSSTQNSGIEITPEKKNWTSYDYVGFWVYNGKAETVEVFPFGNSSLQRTEAPSGKWTFIAWDLKSVDIKDGSSNDGVLQDLENVNKVGIIVARRANSAVNHNTGDYFLISPVRGYNYVNPNPDGIIRFDEESGVGAVGLQSGSRIGYFTWEYDQTVKAEGEAGSTKFKSTVNDKMQIRIQKIYFDHIANINSITLKMWVSNPNSYGIKVNNTVVAANSSGYVEFPISELSGTAHGPRLLIEIKKDNDANLEIDTVVHLGAIVKGVSYTTGENVLSHIGNATIASVYDQTKAEVTYQMTTVHEGDLGAAKISILSETDKTGIEVVPEKKDWSSYDYIGFWVYNGKNADEIVEVLAFGNNDLQRTEAAKGKWTFIAWDLKAVEIKAPDGTLQTLTNVNKVGIRIQRNGPTNFMPGEYFLISPIRGYNFVNPNPAGVIRFDEASGVGAVGLQSSSRIGYFTWEYDQTVKAADEAGSTKFTSNKPNQMEIRIQKIYFNKIPGIDTATLRMWVSNPNSYGIKVNNTVVAANSSGYVEFPITDKSTAGHGYGPRLLITITKDNGAALEVGTVVYLGAIVIKP